MTRAATRAVLGCCVLFALVGVASAQPGAPPTIRRVAVLPLVPADEGARWLGHVLADATARALATNILADLPRSEQAAGAYRAIGSSLEQAAQADAPRAGRALGAEFVVHGWVRWEGDAAIVDAELLDLTRGTRLFAQTFRGSREKPLEPAVALASRVSIEMFGAPLLSAASEAGAPSQVPPSALESYGTGLAALDGAYATADPEQRASGLREACREFARAAGLRPDFAWPFEPLLRAASEMLLSDPTAVEPYTHIALARRALGDAQGAATILRDGVARLPQEAALQVTLADVLLDLAAQGGPDRPSLLREAMAIAERATTLDSSLQNAWVLLGAAAFDSGTYARAAEAYARAAALRPMDAISELGLGLALVRIGRWAEGKPHLELVTHLDSGALGQRARSELDRLGM
jgi:TolB-like protein